MTNQKPRQSSEMLTPKDKIINSHKISLSANGCATLKINLDSIGQIKMRFQKTFMPVLILAILATGLPLAVSDHVVSYAIASNADEKYARKIEKIVANRDRKIQEAEDDFDREVVEAKKEPRDQQRKKKLKKANNKLKSRVSKAHQTYEEKKKELDAEFNK